MLRSRLLLLMAGGALLSLPAGAQAQGQSPRQGPTVEAARQVTTDTNPSRAFPLPQIAVHPQDPSTAAIAATDARNGPCSLYVTRDAGRSWTKTISNMLPQDMDYCLDTGAPGSYLDLTFASDGTLYVVFFGGRVEDNYPDGQLTGYLLRTEDLGTTHQTTTIAEPEAWTYEPEDGPAEEGWLSVRHPRVAVHPTNPNQVYVTYRFRGKGVDAAFDEVPDLTYVRASTDGGATWSEPTNLSTLVQDQFEEGDAVRTGVGPIEVGADGTVHVLLNASETFFLATSTDGGDSWQAREIGEGEAGSGGDPVMALDPNRGHLYVVWHQRRGEEELPPAHVYMFRSTDRGQTWDELANLTADEGPARSNHYHPGLSVAPNGRVDVAWYDYRHDLGRDPDAAEGSMGTQETERYWDVYLTSSRDGGESWSPGLRVTDRSVDAERGVSFHNMDVIGGIGVAATNRTTLLTWGDTRAADSVSDVEDAYFTQVRHAAPVVGASTVREFSGTPLTWIVLGAGGALAIAGLVLFAATRTARRGFEEPAVEPVPSRE